MEGFMTNAFKRISIYGSLLITLLALSGCLNNPLLPWGPGGSQKSNVPAVCSQFVIGLAR